MTAFLHSLFAALAAAAAFDSVNAGVVRGAARRQASTAVAAGATVSAQAFTLSNTDGQEYLANLTIGGHIYSLQVDMAGADTWIAMNASTAPASADLDSAVTLPLYNITGEAVQASVKLGAYALSQQTIVQVEAAVNSLFDADGVLGIGPAGTSTLSPQFSPAVLPTLLSEAPSNLFTLLLPRNGTGTLTLGAPPAGLMNVTTQPSLPLLATTRAWATTLASQGVLVNGAPVRLPASNSSAPVSGSGTSLVVGFDSTNLFSVVPASIAEHIYSGLPTAFFDDSANAWRVPCDIALNVSLVLGSSTSNVSVPMHPLDMLVAPQSDRTCYGSFAPPDPGATGSVADIMLGTTFLHNALLLLAPNATGPGGRAQLLPLTDPARAGAEFVTSRAPPTTAAQAAPVNFSAIAAAQHPSAAPRRLQVFGGRAWAASGAVLVVLSLVL